MRRPVQIRASFAAGVFASALLVAGVGAQERVGLLTGMPPDNVLLTTINYGVLSEAIARIPAESYRGIGEFVTPDKFRLRGAVIRLRDANPITEKTFDLHVYLEDGNSNRPTIRGPQAPGTTAIVSERDVPTPRGVAEPEIEVVFSTPVDVPYGSDVFLGVVTHSSALSVRAMGGSSLPSIVSASLDACGAASALGSSYVLSHDNLAIVEVSTGTIGWQMLVDLLVDTPSGVAVVSRYGNTPFTASLYSGLHPDAVFPPHHTARLDVPGYLFRANGHLATGSPVFLIAATEAFSGPPWFVLQPGNAPVLVPPFTAFPLVSGVTDAAGEALLSWPVMASSAMRGVGVTTQAFGFDLAAGVIRAGTAVRQRF
ncbi:MAG: hypothetical protein NXI31_14845 [bacterium]|nr:hypothetical protein [bacterium]